jgi:hypothetical protein
MANNRITYATAQLSIKDYRMDATTKILGWHADATLASGISSAVTGTVNVNESISGVWGYGRANAGQVRIRSAGGTIEYIKFNRFVSESGMSISARGAAGSTKQAHLVDDTVQLVGWEVPLGVQSVSIGTTFNTEDVFHLGQLDAYENVEGIPEIEVTIERVLDGTKPLWLICTDPDFTTLKGRTADYRVDAALSVYPDSGDSATGTPDSTVCSSGCYISSWSCSFPTDGNFTESVTLVGNDKTWGNEEGIPSGFFLSADAYDAGTVGSGVQRTENFDRSGSTLPSDIQATDHIQSIEVSVDITREEIYELGAKTPYYRSVSYPVTVTTTFEVITDKGDLVTALGNGRNNLTNQTILLVNDDGLRVNLGTKNKLSSVSFEGFDAGGGNGTCTFEYTNSNSLTITHVNFLSAFDTNTDLPGAGQ